MKSFIFLLAGVLWSAILFGQTQSDMNADASLKFKAADKKLNLAYQRIIINYKADTGFLKNLRISQRIWIQFRDAEMITRYPVRTDGYYGSIQPMCWLSYKTELTNDRTKKLMVWLKGEVEGDVCAGSIMTK